MKNNEEQLKVLKRISNNLVYFFWITTVSISLTLLALIIPNL